MLVNYSSSNINFGWEGPTHKALSQAGANKVNKDFCGNSTTLIFNVQKITDASILPDKERHLPGSHAADITKLRNGDALSSFEKIDKRIKQLIKKGSYDELSEYIGKALHYLQDMMNPFHVTAKPKLSQSEKNSHFRFEKDTVLTQHDYITLAKETPLADINDFPAFLNRKMHEAKEKSDLINTPLSKRKAINLKTMQKEAVIDSFQVSYAYLRQLAKVIKKSLVNSH